ncbi:MAG: hypothetical protein MHMPM18_001419 [Marteilia pararefringens]
MFVKRSISKFTQIIKPWKQNYLLVNSRSLVAMTDGCRNNNFFLAEQDIDRLEHKSDSAKGKILVFSATWCPPCQKLKPHLYELADVHENIEIVYCDVDKLKKTTSTAAAQHSVTSLPTLVFFEPKKSEPFKKILGFNLQSIQLTCKEIAEKC